MQEIITSDKIIIAAGTRPTLTDNIPDIGKKVITSDDLFSLK
jgi:pyruvate/2-oxoglutarate dehydrogenase complex dihydrolipoamide dehydrogenase (E3) component